MSVFFEGNAYIDGGKVESTDILFATIQKSSIDMFDQNITSLKDPRVDHPQDAATKKYVDNQVSSLGIVFRTIRLEGDAFVIVSSDHLYGSFVITINSNVESGPTATFYVSKGRPEQFPHIVRNTCSPGSVSKELLEVDWEPNSGLRLRKTGNDYDGEYVVKLI